jgi:hypothetical protein
MLPENTSRGENVLQGLKKVSLTPTDQINQQTVMLMYMKPFVWKTRYYQKNWSKRRDNKRSLCQMILKKIALPVDVDGKSFWEVMLLGFTNDKFCSLRANFKQELFEQFQGKLFNINILIVQ